MFFGRDRVEEDLARIRHANIPDKYPDPGERRKRGLPRLRRKSGGASSAERFSAKDTLAMIIAVFSLVMPYVAAFFGVMGLLVFLVWWFW
ncbi:MAG: hypothetical protein LBS11_01945 [Oscillospiraceae bacterium]|nr:hypothetical protein [Oscillospiraceae bacterium]